MNRNIFDRIPDRGYLLTAIIIFAVANPVTRKLTELGAQNLVNGRNPISFCNVLFVGNICALILLILIYGKQLNGFQFFRQLSRSDWLGLIVVAILSGALAPALIFSALEITAVNNVVLIGRIEPPLALAFSVFFLKERVNNWIVLGAITSFIGVALIVVLQTVKEDFMMEMMGIQIGRGELMAAGGALALAISTIISKIQLSKISLGTFSIFRNVLGTIVFFVVVIVLFTPSHFTDVFSPFLWQWMIIYSAVIVVGGQLCWFQGLKSTSGADVSLASSFSPIAGILAAYLLLGETPNMAQYIGGSVIVLGIILNQIGIQKQDEEMKKIPAVITAKEMDMEVGYKGI